MDLKMREISEQEQLLINGIRSRSEWKKLEDMRIELWSLWNSWIEQRNRLFPEWADQSVIPNLPDSPQYDHERTQPEMPVYLNKPRYLDSETDSE
jgi:hypothetical protein